MTVADQRPRDVREDEPDERELARDGDRHRPFAWQERRGLRVYQHGLRHEALLRPIGNVVYFMPPYVITREEIDGLLATARAGIEAATCD